MMGVTDLKSYADNYGAIVDRRMLNLSGTFYMLPREQINALGYDIKTFIDQMFGEKCIFTWKKNGRTFRHGNDILEIKDEDVYLGFDGDVIGRKVYNKKTQKEYEIKRRHKTYRDTSSHAHIQIPFVSYDYPNFYDKNIYPYLHNNDKLAEALYNTFGIDNKSDLGVFSQNELYCSIVVTDAKRFICKRGFFYGTIDFGVSVYSLGDSINMVASELRCFADQLFNKYENLNLCVGLNTGYCWGYMAQPLISNSNEDIILSIMAEKTYITKISWSNYISRKTLGLAGGVLTTDSLEINIRYETGGCIIKIDKKLTETKMNDLKIVKTILQPLLFPGEQRVPIDGHFRGNWEPVPILDGEIRIEEDEVVFGEAKEINRSKILEIWA